jgi:lysophospholipase L1-like esterase
MNALSLNRLLGPSVRGVAIGVCCAWGGFQTAPAAPTDFDGDGRSDLSCFEPDTGNWSARKLDGTVLFTGLNWGWNEAHPVPGDYDGDGTNDLAVYHRESGSWYIRKQDGTIFLWAKNFGYDAAHAVVTEDYDGDGATDLALYDPAEGKWYISSLDGKILAWGVQWGWAQAHPVPGDFDGDGKGDLAVYDRFSGKWYIRTLDGLILAWGEPWGYGRARPVTGDFDGDQKTDLAVYDSLAGKWFIRTLSGTVLAWDMSWGFSGSQAVPGDFDGDSLSDLAVYSEADGTWYIRRLDGTVLGWALNWGGKGRVPVGLYGDGSSGFITVAFGDSITYGRGSSSNGPKTAYPRWLDHRLETRFGGFSYVINAGIPGEHTRQGLARIGGVMDTYRPDLLILLQGVNDLLLPDQESWVISNLNGMVQTARRRDIPTVMATLCPLVSRSFSDRGDQHARVISINPSIRALAGQRHAPIAELYAGITSVSNWQNRLFNSNSSIHPNDAGYQILRDSFLEAIRKGLNAGQLPY